MIPHFTYPWALMLLALVPLLSWRFATKSRSMWRYSDRRLLPTPAGARVRWASWGGVVLRTGCLTLAIIAFAGPQWIDEKNPLPTEGISIAMIVDVSSSMAEQDFAWEDTKISRLVGVKKLFRLFVAGGTGPDGIHLPGRPHDMIALVTFAMHPETACPRTLDHAALLKIMEAQEPRIAADEGTTNPGDAIVWALHALQQAPTQRKVLVFLTDGESNVPGKLKPRQAAQLAANLSIPIYAIDASPADPKTKEEVEEAIRAKETLQTLAKMTQGLYLRAQDGRGLLHAYESIDRLERERILSFQVRRFHEGFAWFTLTALACWLTMIGLEATIWRRVP
ncbi:MAG: VWA domain-containing protein [Gemmataceae bacterium]|nr:VWA domain-containing protein [Gemmataceae bacterium]